MNLISRVKDFTPNPIKRSVANTAISYWIKRLEYYLDESTEVTVDTKNGSITVYAPPDSHFANVTREKGIYEPLLVSEFCEKFNHNSVYYDIGAAFGFFTKLAQASGVPPESIYAFEADSTRISYFRETHPNNEVNIFHREIGVSSDEGGRSLRLDDFNGKDPTIVKIDVEGAERKVLLGFAETLRRSTPLLYIEIHPYLFESANEINSDICDFLVDIGYNLEAASHRDSNMWTSVDKESLPTEGTYMLKAEPP